VRASINYEGQAAVELEAACGDARGAYELPLREDAEGLLLDPAQTIAQVRTDVEGGVPSGVVAARFHAAVADATAAACARLAASHGVELVVLSGGVFQNRRLLEATAAALHGTGLRVLVPERLPPGDGGIAYGQAAIAAAA
jgi:hydrogenase maturation protein HypF